MSGIVIVRHGQTPLNVGKVLQFEDTPLSDVGMRQAELLAERLREFGVTRVLCSDYLRARMTIAPFERMSGVAADLEPSLRERHFGELRGRSYADLPDVFSRDYVPPGGEGWSEFEARVEVAWAQVTARAAQNNGALAVVTHGLVCYSLLRHHLTLPVGMAGPASFSNASVTVVDVDAPHRVRVVNDVSHLSEL